MSLNEGPFKRAFFLKGAASFLAPLSRCEGLKVSTLQRKKENLIFRLRQRLKDMPKNFKKEAPQWIFNLEDRP
ncbi:MAG: hypothetical protein K0S07_787 [Chlamydiales bacterium]|jgi:hypothetical protein|nr:hypothetical protein [Chlamydiales bacterium]